MRQTKYFRKCTRTDEEGESCEFLQWNILGLVRRESQRWQWGCSLWALWRVHHYWVSPSWWHSHFLYLPMLLTPESCSGMSKSAEAAGPRIKFVKTSTWEPPTLEKGVVSPECQSSLQWQSYPCMRETWVYKHVTILVKEKK